MYIVGILVSDLVASLATLPFSVYHFNRIALFTTLANLMAGPIIGLLIMPFTLFSLLLMPLGLEYWPLRLVGYGIRLVNDITAYVSSLPSAGYQVLSMPLWGLLMMVWRTVAGHLADVMAKVGMAVCCGRIIVRIYGAHAGYSGECGAGFNSSS